MSVERSETQYRLMAQYQLIKELKNGNISQTEYKKLLNDKAEMDCRIKRLKIKNWQKKRIGMLADKLEQRREKQNGG